MQSVEDIAREIVAREGGFVNDPDDPGGATKHGVTVGTLRRLGLDLTGDSRVDADDVRRLSREQAEAIFVAHYYRAPGIDALPAALRASVFDMYVNSGANAVRILQRLLNDMGQAVEVDGVIGPQTIAAARAAATAAALESARTAGAAAKATAELIGGHAFAHHLLHPLEHRVGLLLSDPAVGYCLLHGRPARFEHRVDQLVLRHLFVCGDVGEALARLTLLLDLFGRKPQQVGYPLGGRPHAVTDSGGHSGSRSGSAGLRQRGRGNRQECGYQNRPDNELLG